jgi:hypothetical protein
MAGMSERMFGRIVMLAAAGTALSACGSESAAGNGQSLAKDNPSAMQNQLEALTEPQRNGVFLRAIRDSGADCQHVERSERAGEHRGFPVWRAWCERETSYTIVITPSGSAQVIADSQARLIHEAPPKEGFRGQ